jgi:membrane protease YdiL (CAAX protease family)
MQPTRRPELLLTRAVDSLAWIWPDLLVRILPMAGVVATVWGVWHPAWLGLGLGRLGVQLLFGLPAGAFFFACACLLQLPLSRLRGSLKVPANAADTALQTGFYVLNAPVEEALFRGLMEGGLWALAGPAAGLAVGIVPYVLYHRLGGWTWPDVGATALIGVPAALAFWLLPGPPSLLGVTLAHLGATCGFLGPGPSLLNRLGLV